MELSLDDLIPGLSELLQLVVTIVPAINPAIAAESTIALLVFIFIFLGY
jgi:hypothetical protein